MIDESETKPAEAAAEVTENTGGNNTEAGDAGNDSQASTD